MIRTCRRIINCPEGVRALYIEEFGRAGEQDNGRVERLAGGRDGNGGLDSNLIAISALGEGFCLGLSMFGRGGSVGGGSLSGVGHHSLTLT